MNYSIKKDVESNFEDTLVKVTEELKNEGFGVLTEIDVKATLKQKLDVEFRNYKILGACNPPFAHQALQNEPEIGLLLPCNVIVYEKEDGGNTIAAIDANAMLSVVENDSVKTIADEINQKLKRVVEAV
jgi:uncharacterized protein (DUF302 family)